MFLNVLILFAFVFLATLSTKKNLLISNYFLYFILSYFNWNWNIHLVVHYQYITKYPANKKSVDLMEIYEAKTLKTIILFYLVLVEGFIWKVGYYPRIRLR